MTVPISRRTRLAIAVALITFPLHAQDRNRRLNLERVEVPASNEQPAGMLEIDGQDDQYAATLRTNVEYAKYGDRRLHLHLLIPRGGRPRNSRRETPALRPAIVYIQGSAWMAQNIDSAIPQLADFAHRGYVVASVEYRHSGEAKAPAQLQDVKAAIRFLRANSRRYRIDSKRMGVWGDSSGGHLAALVGTSNGVEEFVTDDNSDESSAVQAVVDFYGPTDFTKMNDFPSRIDHDSINSPESRVIGGLIQAPEMKTKVQAYNPITYISRDRKLPPFLILHGDRDALVPFNQSVLLFEALRDAKQDVTFYKVKDAGHGDRFWTPKVLQIVHDFFDKHLN